MADSSSLQDEFKAIYSVLKGFEALHSKYARCGHGIDYLLTEGAFLTYVAEPDPAIWTLNAAKQTKAACDRVAAVHSDIFAIFRELQQQRREIFDAVHRKYRWICKFENRMFSLRLARKPDRIAEEFQAEITEANKQLKTGQLPPLSLFAAPEWRSGLDAATRLDRACEKLFKEMIERIESHEKFFGDRSRLRISQMAFGLAIIVFFLANYKNVPDSLQLMGDHIHVAAEYLGLK